ncbi:MAG: NAD(P)-dependent oxidoreductase [Brevundimonas sp.]|nr:NAD(P)-dependent oxidoreductase [Brevundimonas sp.]
MRVLVTGSSGFVGVALVREMAGRCERVAGFSRKPGSDSLHGDLLDLESVRSALNTFKPDVVVNLAGQTALKGAPRDGYAANTVGVKNLVTAVAESSAVKRVIWMSSQLIGRPGVAPRYDTEYDPVDDYGRSKVEGEQIVRQFDGGGKEWVMPRSTTIWGPGMSEHYAGMLRLIERGLYFHIGRRPRRKSYSYIENLTRQLAALVGAEPGLVNRKTLYLADSEPIELRDWTSQFAEEFGRSPPTIPISAARAIGLVGDALAKAGLPAPVTSRRLANMAAEYIYDTGPIERIAGPSPVSNREGVRRTALWYRQHKASVERDNAVLGPATEIWESGWVKRPLETRPATSGPEQADGAAFAGSPSPHNHL